MTERSGRPYGVPQNAQQGAPKRSDGGTAPSDSELRVSQGICRPDGNFGPEPKQTVANRLTVRRIPVIDRGWRLPDCFGLVPAWVCVGLRKNFLVEGLFC
jgi:hypothetical protein